MTHTYQTSDVCRPAQVGAVGPADLTLPNGLSVHIRPLGLDDRAGFADLFARLSPESRHRRYLSPKPRLSSRELTYLVDVDHVRHEAFAAVDLRDGSIAGVGRYAVDGSPGVADIAVEVADELQGMGIGTALAHRVVASARANGFRRLTATTLWDNRPARALLRRLAFRPRRSRGPAIDLDLFLVQPSFGTGPCA